jgi:hypothetical protein
MNVIKGHMFIEDAFLKGYLDRVLTIIAIFRIVAKYVTFIPALLRPCGMVLNYRATFIYLRICYSAF